MGYKREDIGIPWEAWFWGLPIAAFHGNAQLSNDGVPTKREYGSVKPVGEWGNECARGFVRDSRFGPGQVIKPVSRDKLRASRKLVQW